VLISDPELNIARRAHTATRLSDGKVLICGGENAGGLVTQAELYDPATGIFSVSGNLNAPRADHTATLLPDGRVLIAGGRGSVGDLASTEIFNPITGTFSTGPDLNHARSGQSATALTDGRIVFVGGDPPGSVEIYDPQGNALISVGGTLDAPRAMHSAVLLNDGNILIVGGTGPDGSKVLTGEVFDAGSSSVSPVSNQATDGHVHALLRVLPDGKVQIIGGTDHEGMEMYDPAINSFGAHAHVFPLGDNHSELLQQIMDGPTRAAMFRFGASSALLNRRGHTITELPGLNQALVTGGVDSGGAFLNSAAALNSSAASVTTDKLDYAPGTIVIVSGTGWRPNERVRLLFHEDPHVDTENPHDFTVEADANGNFISQQYAPEDQDIGIAYILAATGESSGWTAQTSLQDAETQPPAQAIPYTQTFSGLIPGSTTYPAGWQGWRLATGSSVAFRTNAATGDEALIPNSSASTTATGVHNYNGKVGILAGGATTDPALALAVKTTGYSNITISFDIMTLRNPYDGSSNTRINQVDLQYRVGTSGTFTSVSGLANGIYQNITIQQTGSGVITPQNLQSLAYTLPALCDNQSSVQLRWVQRDNTGAGARPSFAVDNIVVCPIVGAAGSITGPSSFSPGQTGVVYSISAVTNAATYDWTVPTGASITSGQGTLSITVTFGSSSGNVTVTPKNTISCNPGVSSSQAVTVSAPSFSIDDVTRAEGDAGNTIYTFTVTRTGDTTLTSSVEFTTVDGTATVANHDYATSTGTLSFPAGTATQQIIVNVNGDPTVESDEVFTVNLSNPFNATIADAVGTGTILNDDTDVSVAVSPPSVNEDETAKLIYTFTRSGVTTGSLAVNFTVGGMAGSGSDYTQTGAATFTPSSGTILFDAGASTATVTIDAIADTIDEPNEEVVLTVTAGTGYQVGAPSVATGTINDDDAAPSISAGDVSLSEGNSGLTAFDFAITLSNSSCENVTVDYSTQDNTAIQSGDYTINSGTITFLPGETSKQITVQVNGDTTYEANQTFFVNLSNNSTNSTLSDGQSAGTIVNDDSPPALSIGDVTQAEGNSGATAFVFHVSRSGSTEVNATVHFSTADGSATVADGDYAATSGTLFLTPADTDQTISVQVSGDLHVEPSEDFSVNLDTPTDATISNAQGVGNIQNDDASGSYTWTGGGLNTLWINPLNWSPTRIVRTSGDVLIFDGNVTPSPTATDVLTETIKGLHFQNGISTTFIGDAVPGTELTISGADGDLLVEGGGSPSTLTLAGTTPINVSLTSSATGSISGQIVFQDAAHRLIGTAASTMTFHNGSIFTTASGFNGNAFGDGSNTANGAAGSVVFAGGSSYFHSAGSSPFGNSANPAVAVFQSGSLATFLTTSGFEASGRTYANLAMGKTDPDGIAVNAVDPCDNINTCTGNFQFDNLTINSTGAANSSLSFSGSASNSINVHGNIYSTGVGTVPGGTAPDVFLTAGSGGIVINGASTFGNDVSSVRGIFFGSDATVSNGTTLTLGRILQMGLSADKTLTVDVTGDLNGGTVGYVVGKVQRNFAAGNGQMFTYHIGDAAGRYTPATLSNLNVTGGGNITGSTTSNDNVVINNPGSFINVSQDVNRWWNLTRGGGLTLSLYDAAFTYAASDIDDGATEARFVLRKLTMGTWTTLPETTNVDTVTHTITGTGFNNLSDFAVGEQNNQAPVAIDDLATTDEDTPYAFPASGLGSLQANDTDADNTGAQLGLTAVSDPPHGMAVLNGDGSLTYTPDADFNGTDTFTYTLCDPGQDGNASTTGDNLCDTATVTITVNAVNDAPLALDDATTTNEDTPRTLAQAELKGNDTDVDNTNAELSVTAVSNPTNGGVLLNGNGTVTFTPTVNFNGTAGFDYTLSDGHLTDKGHMTLTVNAVNDDPDALDDSITVSEDSGANAISILANDTDAPDTGETLTATAVTQGANGSVAFTSTNVSYTPNVNFFGTDSFTYTISDGNGGSDTATVHVTVANVNDNPDAVDDSATVNEDTAGNAVSVLANDSDADNLSGAANAGLMVIAKSNGSHGTVIITGGGTGLSYAPAANYYGSDSFTYTISDNGTSAAGHTDTATVNVTVNHVDDATTTTVSDKTAPYSDVDQSVMLTATITSPAGQVNGGTVTFTVTNAANVMVGTPVTSATVLAGAASATYTLPGGSGAGAYVITAGFSGSSGFIDSNDSATLNVTPADIGSDAATLDGDFKKIDGFDVLFNKIDKSTLLRLENTNPGTFHYRLTITNTTGADLNSNNGAALRAFIEVPKLMDCGGVPCPGTIDKSLAAFSLKNRKAVKVRPDDKTDDLPVAYGYKSTGDCADPAGYGSAFPGDESPRCVMVSGFALPREHRAEIDIGFEFRWKRTMNWDPNSSLWFYSGLPFKAMVQTIFTTPNEIRTAYFTVGLVGAGQRVTAVGGFSFNGLAQPPVGLRMRLFSLATDASCTSDTKLVAQDIVNADGFYFIWRKGTDQGGSGTNDLPDGVKYVVQICSGNAQVGTLRSLADKLGKKDFDEEDFYDLMWP